VVMNMWAKCYPKHKGANAGLIGKLNPSFR
jgi:hypothetical protein